MVQAVVFNAENTLYTPVTEAAYKRKFKHVSEETGVPVERVEEIWEAELDKLVNTRDADVHNPEAVLKRTLTELEFDETERETLARDAVDVFWNQLQEDVKLKQGVETVVKRLRDYYRILAVTEDEFRQPLEMQLNQVFGDWREYFDFVVTPEDTGLMKPSGVYYSTILAETRFAPEDVIVIGNDWHHDLKPAQNLGMKTVLVAARNTGNPDVHVESLEHVEEALQTLHTE